MARVLRWKEKFMLAFAAAHGTQAAEKLFRELT